MNASVHSYPRERLQLAWERLAQLEVEEVGEERKPEGLLLEVQWEVEEGQEEPATKGRIQV